MILLSAQTCPDSMADVVESLEVGCASPPKAVGAFRFFLNLGRVEGFGLEGNGRSARRDPLDKQQLKNINFVLFE